MTEPGVFDPAVQNIILACRGVGLGTTITTNHIRCEDEVKAVLGVPDDVQTFALMPIGYPIDRFGPVVRRPIAEVAHSDRRGQPWPARAEPAAPGSIAAPGMPGRAIVP